MAHRYLVALGSNVRHRRHGGPALVIAAALERLDRKGLHVEAASRVIETAPLGPSRRRYVNAAAVVKTRLDPLDLLARLQHLEAKFGRRRRGQRWGARVLDLDIVLWSGGAFAAQGLIVPHRCFRERGFVLGPAAQIAAGWRDPITGLTLRQLTFRLQRRLTAPRCIP